MSLLIIGNINTAFSEVESVNDLTQLPWIPPIVNDVGGNLAFELENNVEAILGVEVAIEIECPYAIRGYANTDLEVSYGIHVSSDISSILGIVVSEDYDFINSIGFLFKDLECSYGIRDLISNDFSSRFDLKNYVDYSEIESKNSISLNTDVESLLTIRSFVNNDLESLHTIYSTIISDFNAIYSFLNTNFIVNDLRSIYAIFDPTYESIATDANFMVDGQQINYDSFDISHDEDSFCWTFTASLSSISDWMICEPGKPAVLTIGTDIYNFIIDTRDEDTSFESDSFSISGRSPSSIYGDGSKPVHKTWGPVTSFEALDELIPSGITKNIANWNILDGRLNSDGEFAISIVKQIAEADGCIVYSTTEGDLVIQSKYKVPPPLYDINNVDYTISDLSDIFQIAQSRTTKPGYNQVEVSDEPSNNKASISIDEIEKNLITFTATLKVTIYPFVSTLELLSSYQGLTIAPSLAPVYEEITELVEIVNGSGSVSSPIDTLLSTNYKNNFNLGDLDHNGNEITSEVNGTSLVEVTYRTQYHLFTVDIDNPDLVQVYTWED